MNKDNYDIANIDLKSQTEHEQLNIFDFDYGE